MSNRRGCGGGRRHGPTISAGWARRRDHEVQECRRVRVDPFRERFLFLRERGEMTMNRLCLEMGWAHMQNDRVRPRRVADTSTGRRRLGLIAHRGCTQLTTTIDYDSAVRLCRVLGLDPHEAGC